ncbi:MAG TPA: 2-phospho-L-lactate guanylyltransferase [Acidimicrobiia bacterium]
MPIAVLIPIRSFASGKERLGAILSDNQRLELGAAMAARTTEAVEEAGLLPAVVTGDPEVERWATLRGIVTIGESGPGLNRAANDAVDWADSNRLQWLVLHGDLPVVSSGDIEELARTVGSGVAVVAPSSDGGTSAISSPHRVDFSYGPASFHRHLGGLNEPRIVCRTGLLHDLDSPDDLASALSHPDGKWVSQYVGGVGR